MLNIIKSMSSNTVRRRIIVCLDGTWETPQGKATLVYACWHVADLLFAEKTNVYKFFSSIDTKFKPEEWDHRIEYYPGLGTTGSFPLLGGAFGFGITNQIQSAYKFICKNYQDENDEIWLLGFSRGGTYTNFQKFGMHREVGCLFFLNFSVCCKKLVWNDLQCRTFTRI